MSTIVAEENRIQRIGASSAFFAPKSGRPRDEEISLLLRERHPRRNGPLRLTSTGAWTSRGGGAWTATGYSSRSVQLVIKECAGTVFPPLTKVLRGFPAFRPEGAVAHSQGRLAAPGIGCSQARSSAPPGRGSRVWAETTRGGLASRPWLWTSAPSGRNAARPIVNAGSLFRPAPEQWRSEALAWSSPLEPEPVEARVGATLM